MDKKYNKINGVFKGCFNPFIKYKEMSPHKHVYKNKNFSQQRKFMFDTTLPKSKNFAQH